VIGAPAERSGEARRALPTPLERYLASPPAVAALAVYLALALILFGAPLFHSANQCICLGTDEGIFVWAMAWWPHAIFNGLNPFYSHIIYAPHGFDIALGALVPGAALLLAPVTAIAGPLFSYNLAMLLSPVLAAFFAFLLCRRITGRFWPSLVGGWIYGFSTYMFGELLGHMQLTLVFLVPAIVHLVLRGLSGEIRRRWFVVLMVVCLAFQFLFSAEVFVSFTLFGAVAYLAAYLLGDPALRERLLGLLPPIAGSYLVTAVIVSPYLYYALQPGGLPILLGRTDHFSADLLSFVVPTLITKVGGAHFLSTSNRFNAGFVEGGTYLGLPLIAIIVLAARRYWRSTGVRVALITLAAVGICALGGKLQIRGMYTIPLPWAIFHRLPVLGQALPVRFVVYVFLIAGILAAMWLATASWRPGAWALGALAVVFLWPAIGRGFWRGAPDLPKLFTSSAYSDVIGPHDTALLLPVGGSGFSMLWQAEDHLRFTMASGYVVPPEAPDPYKRYAIYPTLTTGAPVPDEERAAASFIASNHITVAVLDPTFPVSAPWVGILRRLGWVATPEGNVYVFRPGPDATVT
jgi:hypothetical protein